MDSTRPPVAGPAPAPGQIRQVALPDGTTGQVVICSFTEAAAQRHGVVGTVPVSEQLTMATDWDLRVAAPDSTLDRPFLAAAWHCLSVCLTDLGPCIGTLHPATWAALRRLYWANVGSAPRVPAEVASLVGPPLHTNRDPRYAFQVAELQRWEPVAERAWCQVLRAP